MRCKIASHPALMLPFSSQARSERLSLSSVCLSPRKALSSTARDTDERPVFVVDFNTDEACEQSLRDSP